MEPLEWRIFRARCFLVLAWPARELDPHERQLLEELLTGDWDGRGCAGDLWRKLQRMAGEFEAGWMGNRVEEKVWKHGF